MKLIFEKSIPGRGCTLLSACDVTPAPLPEHHKRERELRLPQISEIDISRHYTDLIKRTFGVNNGFYPLGSCTMKYNPRINEEIASWPAFTRIHPLQPVHTVQGCLEVLALTENYLCEITGMDAMSLQPAAGAQGEFTGLLLVKAYHASRGDRKRTKILIPDSAHGTNPASAAMAGFTVVNIPSNPEGCVDLEELRAAAGEDTAGLMLTNPNTVGIFDRNIAEITKIVHDAGGLNYYDGANLNAIMGIVRPGDMGFDVVHLNLHKTFSTPHGGGGPGSGPVGCKRQLSGFLPDSHPAKSGDGADGSIHDALSASIGRVNAFYGNFLVIVRALAYLLTLGNDGLLEASRNAVLHANYMKGLLCDLYDMAYDGVCMHEFVMTLEHLRKETGVSALDVAKGFLDHGMHPPTMYFPLLVHEALMVEPTETESKETIDRAVAVYRKVYEQAYSNPQALHDAPVTTPVRRLDEVGAARNPRLKYSFEPVVI